MDPRDSIDNDEGCELSAPTSETPHCDGRGQPVEELNPCSWDTTLQAGKCCEVYTDYRCPDCGSDALEFLPCEGGMEAATGQRSEEEYARCRMRRDLRCPLDRGEDRAAAGHSTGSVSRVREEAGQD